MTSHDADRVITTSQDMVEALTEKFLNNADSGDHSANDELTKQLTEWQRTGKKR